MTETKKTSENHGISRKNKQNVGVGRENSDRPPQNSWGNASGLDRERSTAHEAAGGVGRAPVVARVIITETDTAQVEAEGGLEAVQEALSEEIERVGLTKALRLLRAASGA